MTGKDGQGCGTNTGCGCHSGEVPTDSADVSRRAFLQAAGGTGLGLWGASALPGVEIMAGPFEAGDWPARC